MIWKRTWIMRVLTEADRHFWEENGYVIVHNAVPQENLDAVIDAIWAFLEMDRHNPESWYREPSRENGMAELNKAGMVELYHHPSMWNNRQHPRVYGAFVDVLGTEKLWVTIDRVNMNPPARPNWDFKGFIHWDIDTGLRPIPFEVQGVLSLTDTSADQGGFQCVPGFVKHFEEWVKTQPADRNTWRPDLTGLDVQPIETKAGDLLIWHSLLPHGTGRNNSNRPRLAQYISMFPAKVDDEALRQERIQSWRERLPRKGFAFPGDPREWEIKHGRTAELTELGKRLLGLVSWEVPLPV
jgi:ectoine hydroxylase-related dioxygenase (phytanoyl-CoA dioxygenase family)